MHIYPRVLRSLKDRGWITGTDTVLVVAGGDFDRQSMQEAEVTNVTISNLDYHEGIHDYAPYEWKRLDAEKLELDDNSYDWVVVHAGLHHLAVPALGVCEMFRVARRGILCFEARDSLLMKLAIRFGLTTEYELEPAFLTSGSHGGYRNGPIPNYVYRWKEREFEKVVNSYAPTHRHTFFYDYAFQVPAERFKMAKSPLYRFAGLAIARLAGVAETIVPRQCNRFAFGVLKNTSVQPWLTADLRFDDSSMAGKYDKTRYRNVDH
jgi:SAM-dependent methyltransferase